MLRTIKCKICGCDVETTSNNRKYCDICKEDIKPTYKNHEETLKYMNNYYQNHKSKLQKYARDRRVNYPIKVSNELKRYRMRKKKGISAKYRIGIKRSIAIKDNSHLLERFGLTADEVAQTAQKFKM